jgi:hypothetical protein
MKITSVTIEFHPAPSLFAYDQGDAAERFAFTPATSLAFGRSKRTWRTPRMHIVAGFTHNTYADGAPEEYVVWWCGPNTAALLLDKASVHDALPDGFEACQPCAERMAFERKRIEEQVAPDREAYNAETHRLLKVAGR